MSKVIIDYSEISNAAKKAKKASDYFSDLYGDLNKHLVKKLNYLDNDSSTNIVNTSNISDARSLLNNKVLRDISNKKTKFSNVSNKINSLNSSIQGHEKTVVKQMNKIAKSDLGIKEQGGFKGFVNWIYGVVCVDLVNSNPFTRKIGNFVKGSLDWVQEKGSKAIDWFKHGEGKYWLGIAMDGLAVVGSVIATVGAIALAVGTGGAATPLVVAAVASTVGTVMTAVDAGFSIYNKSKALKNSSKNNDPGRARYFGNISGVNDTIKKTDMGGETANNVWGFVGKGYDLTHTAADITAVVAGGIGQAGLTGAKTVDPKTGKVTLEVTRDPKVVKDNLKKVFKQKIGMSENNGKWTFDAKKLFKKEQRETIGRIDIYKKKIVKDVVGKDLYKTGKTIKKITGVPTKIYKRITNAEKILDSNTSTYDKVKSGVKIIGSSKRNISSPAKDINDTVFTIIDAVRDLAA